MKKRFHSHPSPTTVIACLALFFAVAGGSAIALQGRNSVDSGDIKKGNVKTSDIRNNAVTTKKIRNNHVRAADIQANAVGASEIGDGQVGVADLTPPEAYRKVGAAGQPAFVNGVEGDCLYSNAPTPSIRVNPVAFYKDPQGRVHLSGIGQQNPGPGGDTTCGGAGEEAIEDRVVFILPEGYRPANDEVRQITDTFSLLIAGTTPIVTPGGTVPAGAVYDLSNSGVILEDISFRAAGPGTGLPRSGGGSGSLPGNIADLLG